MKRLVLLLLGMLIGWFFASTVLGAEPAAKPAAVVATDVVPAPNVKQQAGPADETFGRRPIQEKDEGLKKLIDKDFRVPAADPFAGLRIVLWGISIAGILIGLTIAALIVVFALKFIRKTAVPQITGVPDATFATLQLFDNIQQRIENRRKELAAESAEIDRRMGKQSKPKAS